MIEVYGEKKGTRCRLCISGHAVGGEDAALVCAGISALTGALVDYAEACGNCRHLRAEAANGSLFLSCHGGLGAAFDMVWQGILDLARAYPQHLRIVAAFFSEGEPKKGKNELTTNRTACDKIATKEPAPVLSDTAKE